MKREKSRKLFDRAVKVIPGGVNSPVRAFKSVGGDPVFIKKASGAYLYDEDDNAYLDLFNSWGPMILGHNHEGINKAVKDAVENSLSFGAPTNAEVDIAELIVEMVPSLDKVRMVNSGTEATMSAIRVARGFTGKDKIIKFAGCYHGHGDSFLIEAGSGVATLGIPDSPGVTKGTAKDTLTAKFNDLESVYRLLEANKNEIAAIIVEPVAGNMGCIPPKPGFLEGLREICSNENIVLIFDEVMTGFRLAPGGAQEFLGVVPDMTTLGKIIGGGMPVGAYGGKAEIMDFVAPLGPVYQAGTLSGNPVSMAAGLTMLKELKNNPGIYENLTDITEKLASGIQDVVKSSGKSFTYNTIGSMYTLFFNEKEVYDFDTAKESDTVLFSDFFNSMLNDGVFFPPSQFESVFISTEIGGKEVQKILESAERAFNKI